jgi:hypothetical protein
MVAFNFDPRAVFFHSGLDTIEQGYRAAIRGIAQEIDRKKAAAYDYTRHIATGGAPIEERDDEDRLIWSNDDLLESTIQVAEDALMSLRKAYTVAVYHYWERSALQWTGKTNEKHDRLAALVEAMGYPIDPRLHALRDLANLLKHASEKWGVKLHGSWSTLFPSNFVLPTDGGWRADWYEQVSLTEDDFLKVLTIVRASGPTNPPINF